MTVTKNRQVLVKTINAGIKAASSIDELEKLREQIVRLTEQLSKLEDVIDNKITEIEEIEAEKEQAQEDALEAEESARRGKLQKQHEQVTEHGYIWCDQYANVYQVTVCNEYFNGMQYWDADRKLSLEEVLADARAKLAQWDHPVKDDRVFPYNPLTGNRHDIRITADRIKAIGYNAAREEAYIAAGCPEFLWHWK